VKRLLLLLTLGLVLAGCGGDDEAAETNTVTLPVESVTAKAYVVRDGRVWPVERGGGDILEILRASALDAVMRGPTDEEVAELDAETAIPEGAEAELTVVDGVAEVEITGADDLSDLALAQIVYTLTQFPGIESVSIEGRTYTRADFEEQTPSVLVESPLPFEEVSSPITATGTANTFEANFQYELLDADGNVVDENFVTATSGTGTRGTFEFTTAEVDDVATLVVFETSAEDGSRIREVEIPLTRAS
jgi:hypothetical protein